VHHDARHPALGPEDLEEGLLCPRGQVVPDHQVRDRDAKGPHGQRQRHPDVLAV
jgi:hypothetical protein